MLSRRLNSIKYSRVSSRVSWLKGDYTYVLRTSVYSPSNHLTWLLAREYFIWISVIQGVSRLVDITVGGDFLGLCDQKSSYKHLSDFGRLRSYGHFLIPHTHSYEPRLTEPAGGWCTQLGGLSFALQALYASRDSRSSQPSGSLFCGRWWNFRKSALSTDQFKLKVISRS